jgi:hypothetical protein
MAKNQGAQGSPSDRDYPSHMDSYADALPSTGKLGDHRDGGEPPAGNTN